MLVSIIRKGQNFQRCQKTGKNLNKIIRPLLLTYYLCHAIQKQQGLHTDQNIPTSVKNKLMITDGNKQHYLAVTCLHCLKESYQIIMDIFIVLTALIHTPQRINLKNMMKYAKNTTAAS